MLYALLPEQVPVACTVKLYVPAVVGVPFKTPPDESVSPAGNVEPALADQDQMSVTADAVFVNVTGPYAVFTVPLLNGEAGLMTTVGHAWPAWVTVKDCPLLGPTEMVPVL